MNTALESRPATITESPCPLPTVLVVDDQDAVRNSVAFFLQMSGYATLRASSGQEALDVARSSPVDGVLLDVQMPRMNGIETCRKLVALGIELGRPTKVWFMTGIHYPGLHDECAQAGGLAIFHKPFDWPQLLGAFGRDLGCRELPAPPPAPGSSTEN